jgi:hypothetical protein
MEFANKFACDNIAAETLTCSDWISSSSTQPACRRTLDTIHGLNDIAQSLRPVVGKSTDYGEVNT